jgi:hypothetical protein
MTIQSSNRRLVLICLAILVVAGTGLIVWRVHRAVQNLTKPVETEVDLGAVTTRIRNLNRLETASMHVVHVSTITQEYQLVPNSIGGDTLTLFAGGDVIAGVDLSLLGPNDIWRTATGVVVIKLPPPMVLVTRIDNKETRVVSRKTGFLRRADPGLEGRARLYAEGGVRSEAVRKGILQLARTNAQMRIAELLHATGINRIEFVDVAPAPVNPER